MQSKTQCYSSEMAFSHSFLGCRWELSPKTVLCWILRVKEPYRMGSTPWDRKESPSLPLFLPVSCFYVHSHHHPVPPCHTPRNNVAQTLKCELNSSVPFNSFMPRLFPPPTHTHTEITNVITTAKLVPGTRSGLQLSLAMWFFGLHKWFGEGIIW